MFNNRFNSTKKDPLVEAVQSAMQDGEIRRQAEALVNEEFGVYSRKAVVREHLAAYDARLEEAYKCMKEDEKKDEKPKSVYSKEKDKHKAAYSKMREKMVGKGKDLETTRKIVGEEAKKLADKDYDKDGKIETPKDEVWGSRFRAAKMAGKMEEEKSFNEMTPAEKIKWMRDQVQKGKDEKKRLRKSLREKPKKLKEETQLDELENKTLRKYKAKAIDYVSNAMAGKKGKEGISKLDNRVTGIERANKRMGVRYEETMRSIKADPNDPSYQGGGDVTSSAPDRAAVTRDNKPSTPAQTNAATSGPSAADKAALTSKIKIMKEAVYSAKAARAGKDIGKPGKEFKKIAKSAAERYGSEERGKKVAGAILKRIRAKHMKEENLEELSAFGAEFAKQRAAGAKTFSWGGKTITTQLKGQTGSSSAPRPSVTSAPKTASAPKVSSVTSGTSRFDTLQKLGSTPAPAPSTSQTKQASDIVRDKGPTFTRQYSFPGSTVAPPKADVDTKTPKKPATAADVSGGSKMAAMDKLSTPPAPTPAETKQASDIVRGKGPTFTRPESMAGMNESVQVGDNKYRIV